MRVCSFDVGFKNLGVCVLDTVQNRILFWRVLNIPLGDLCRGLLQALEVHGGELEVADVVVVEKQSKKSQKMLCIAAYLEAFFVMRGKKVVMFGARHKLLGTGQENSGAGNYRKRKQAAVALAGEFLSANAQEEAIRAVWDGLKKKDDAADALLQAVAFAKHPVRPEPKVTPRKPTAKAMASKKYTPNALMWLLEHEYRPRADRVFYLDEDVPPAERLTRCVEQDKAFTKAVLRHFTDVQACVRAFEAC